MKTKRCTKCKKRKLLSNFYASSTGIGGVRGDCKGCVKIYHQNNYQIYGDRYIKQKKKHRKTFVGSLQYRFINIKQRCSNPKNVAYKYYGGRGIKCLFKSSKEFIDYILNELKIDPHGLDVDRIDNNGNYEPGNIRLVTHKENCNNRRKTRKEQR